MPELGLGRALPARRGQVHLPSRKPPSQPSRDPLDDAWIDRLPQGAAKTGDHLIEFLHRRIHIRSRADEDLREPSNSFQLRRKLTREPPRPPPIPAMQGPVELPPPLLHGLGGQRSPHQVAKSLRYRPPIERGDREGDEHHPFLEFAPHRRPYAPCTTQQAPQRLAAHRSPAGTDTRRTSRTVAKLPSTAPPTKAATTTATVQRRRRAVSRREGPHSAATGAGNGCIHTRCRRLTKRLPATGHHLEAHLRSLHHLRHMHDDQFSDTYAASATEEDFL